MPDLAAAVAHPAPVVCDATVATPLRLRPLDEGCDVVLHSATKILAGHDDVLAGVTVTRDAELRDRLHLTRRLAGIVASADTAWLVRRGLGTLALRLDRQEATARLVADRLADHPAVATVRYPGFSFLLSFDVADGEAAGRVERVGARDRERDEPRRDPTPSSRHGIAGRATGSRPGSCGSRSASRSPTSSGPTSTRPSPPSSTAAAKPVQSLVRALKRRSAAGTASARSSAQ